MCGTVHEDVVVVAAFAAVAVFTFTFCLLLHPLCLLSLRVFFSEIEQYRRAVATLLGEIHRTPDHYQDVHTFKENQGPIG